MTQPASELKAICHCQPTGSPLEDWLRNIRDVQRLHAEELTAISDPEQKVRRPSSARVLPSSSAYEPPQSPHELRAASQVRRVVELNVIEQCLNIYKTGVVQRRRLLTSSVKSAGGLGLRLNS